VDKPAGSERMGGREETVAEGVTVRVTDSGERTSIRIAFQFRGTTCRERLTGLAVTPPNIRYAVRLRGEILNAIARGTFNYADHFPRSPRARRFGFAASGKTVGELLDEYEALARPTVAASTWLGYSKVIERCLRPWFGATRLRRPGAGRDSRAHPRRRGDAQDRAQHPLAAQHGAAPRGERRRAREQPARPRGP
jgi:integrase